METTVRFCTVGESQGGKRSAIAARRHLGVLRICVQMPDLVEGIVRDGKPE